MSPYQAEKKGLSVTSYTGDGSVLLAFDMDQDQTRNLAGFAIKALAPNKGPYKTNEYWLKNRLNFEKGVSGDEELAPEKWVESNRAPFQSFHWVYYPGAGPGRYTFTVYPAYLKHGGPPELGQGVSSAIDLDYHSSPRLELGFTRGYISSQAYADRFSNKPISPQHKTIDFDTTPYRPQYQWLGGHARELIFDFLKECCDDKSVTVDIFSYDLDEPDIIGLFASLGTRLRMIQDYSDNRKKHDDPALVAAKKLEEAGAEVKYGKFHSLAHDKVFIKKKNGRAAKVLTGSANFSIRGLYVQSNSVLVYDDPGVADLYERAFEEAFTDMNGFQSSDIASKWFEVPMKEVPPTAFSFAPHEAIKVPPKDVTAFPLETVADAISSAKSSVLFAIMVAGTSTKAQGEVPLKGPVVKALANLGSAKDIFSLGTIDYKSELSLFKGGKSNGVTVTSNLGKNVPPPFKKELSGFEGGKGFPGHVIHHKFVVCDFNEANPVVFCGSSNLSGTGETKNGDNLIAIRDPAVAYSYAVEAIRLYDHYRFRSLQEGSTSAKPLLLDASDRWVDPYYDPDDLKYYERQLFGKSQAGRFAPAAAAAQA